jgi:tRNA U34 5-methylaminomethyl-2-thiouridine-forming methyltransferase MnmC
MKREIIATRDGSHTVSIPEMEVTYHSIHGAVQESEHVFIEAGLKLVSARLEEVRIFEMGFGTGLNALLTLAHMETNNNPVHYSAVELYPLTREETAKLNYCNAPGRRHLQPLFDRMHSCDWEVPVPITNAFNLLKSKNSIQDFQIPPETNLVYFDAFAPLSQPELWTVGIFSKILKAMSPEGILVTYCSKADVRRAMTEAGFRVEKLPGPPRKREMLRAFS